MKIPSGVRTKGSPPKIKQQQSSRPKGTPDDEAQYSITLRRTLGRLAEWQRMDKAKTPKVEQDRLLRKLRTAEKARKLDLEKPTQDEIDRIQKELNYHQAHRYRTRMDKWKDKMTTDEIAAFRWLRGGTGPPVVAIFSAKAPKATQSIEEVLKVLGEHWSEVWERQRPSLEEIQKLANEELEFPAKQENGDLSQEKSCSTGHRGRREALHRSMDGRAMRSHAFR